MPKGWGGKSEDFQDHVTRHEIDFNTTSPEEYVNMSQDFYQRYLDEKLPALEYPNGGKLAVYDPETNIFGSYSPEGLTNTFFKPAEGQSYYEDLIETQVLRGGKVINPLPGIEPLPEVPLIIPE